MALAVNLVALAGCAERTPPSPGAALDARALAGPFATPGAARFRLPPHPGYTDSRTAGRLAELARRGAIPAPEPGSSYVLDALTSPVGGARIVESGGEALEDALDAAADDGRPVDEWGVGALSLTQLVGDDIHAGLCEFPMIDVTVEHGGEDWDVTLAVALIETFVGDLALAYGELPEDCAAGLLEAAGDAEAAGDCSSPDEAMFFPEGSDCRACLGESLGDVAACQDAGRCAVEAPVLESQGGQMWHRYEGTLLACAPDHTVPVYVLAEADEAGAPPSPFEYGGWGYICSPFWDDYLGEVTHLCSGGGGDTMRVGISGVVEGMRREGDDTPWYRRRSYYTPRVTLEDGTELRWAWEAYNSGGVVAYPVEPDDSNGDGVVDAGDDYYGYQYGSWGLNPLQLRPDGTNPEALDDTFARDWFGALAMKSATTRNGVSILMANKSRCADDAWDDLDGDGVFRCTRTEDPVGGWLGDLPHFRWDPDVGYSYPMPVITLGSTGLADPTIPGGIVPHLAGTPTLGDPEWDDCTWNDTFTPDRAVLPDTPLDYAGPGSVTADTWRFGGHPELDLRVVHYTNYTRDYCADMVTP